LIVFVCLAMAVYQPVSAGETAHYTLAEAELSRAKSDRETAQNGVVQTRAYIVRYALYQTMYRLFYTQGMLPAHVLE
jgi:hypothetical protein